MNDYLTNPGNRLVRQSMRVQSLDSPKIHSVSMSSSDALPEFRAATAAGIVIPLLLGAERARNPADSHRTFKVGAAAFVVYTRVYGHASTIVHGANMKPIEGLEEINVHAEHTVLSRVDDTCEPGERAHVLALAVVGDLQPDQQSGRVTRTLHPCGICRKAFEHPDSPIDENTLFVTANPELTVIEWFSLEALRRVHEDNDDSGIATAEFSERSLMLTLPEWYIDGQRSGIAIPPLEESPEEDKAEREFNDKVRNPIFHYLCQLFIENEDRYSEENKNVDL